ncbi:2834ae20-324c-49ba-9224-d6160bae1d4e [Sclerotinia trifoliorum]|uniref:2834ae20-324c-49ba-9224-d6160bae1d4e n=1 Tax=Sclerotinia trifoliorum TaxID=28548 RepID=A0A8H2ZKJ0_9HELO|nr:2834ae20-324c-49ba-9224-d6160bae1d4e [Sclerotinia trifoliorum]
MLQYPLSLGSFLCLRSANFSSPPWQWNVPMVLSGSVGQGILMSPFATPLHRQFHYLQTFLRTEICLPNYVDLLSLATAHANTSLAIISKEPHS